MEWLSRDVRRSIFNSVVWFTVSKALEKSIAIAMVRSGGLVLLNDFLM